MSALPAPLQDALGIFLPPPIDDATRIRELTAECRRLAKALRSYQSDSADLAAQLHEDAELLCLPYALDVPDDYGGMVSVYADEDVVRAAIADLMSDHCAELDAAVERLQFAKWRSQREGA